MQKNMEYTENKENKENTVKTERKEKIKKTQKIQKKKKKKQTIEEMSVEGSCLCRERHSIQTMTFTLIWVSISYTDTGFPIESGFKKRFSPRTRVLVLNLISLTTSLHNHFHYRKKIDYRKYR